MLRSWAPSGVPMRTKSPSLVSAAQPPKTGALRWLRRSSTSWVKPPEAKITALRARTRSFPSGPVASTPATAPSLVSSRWTRCSVRTSTPSRSAAALSVRMPFRPPSDIVSRASRGTNTRPVGASSSGSSDQ